MIDPFYSPASVDAFGNIFSKNATVQMIPNLNVTPLKLPFAEQDLPATLGDKANLPNCYICDPTTAYIDYAMEETRLLTHSKLLLYATMCLIKTVAPIVKTSGMGHQVQVNNWMFSTNPVPPISTSSAKKLLALSELYPDRAIIMRSLNSICDTASLQALIGAGFRLLPARQIYVDDGTAVTRDMKSDRKLVENTNYAFVKNDGFTLKDYDDCAALYRQLYLEKYPNLNPQYSAEFIRLLHESEIIHMQAWRAGSGKLIAFGGTFCGGNVLTQPLLGYDTSRPQSEGLYRMITSLAQSKARAEGKLFNMSAGVGKFKRTRGALPAIEYTAVFVEHLSKRQRYAVRVIEKVLTQFGIPILERYGL